MQLLEGILGKKNNIRILRYLVKHKDWNFNITEFSKDTGINKGVLSRLIQDLGKNNIIEINRKGKISLFKLNKKNIVIKELIAPLFELEDKFFNEHIKNKILKIKSNGLISLILFGSYAREDFKITSDVDLIAVVKKKNSKLSKLFENLKINFLKQDLILNVDIIAIQEFKRLYRIGEPLIKSIETNHKIISGKKFKELI